MFKYSVTIIIIMRNLLALNFERLPTTTVFNLLIISPVKIVVVLILSEINKSYIVSRFSFQKLKINLASSHFFSLILSI